MTGLRSALERYLSMRQGLGYKYRDQASRLRDFVSFMEARKAKTVTTKPRVVGQTVDRRARFRATYRKHRSEDGGATHGHLFTMEASEALCLQ